MGATRYVLLCRHGRHRDGVLVRQTGADGSLEHPIDLVASRLKQQLQIEDPPGRAPIRLKSIWCSPSAVARKTAGRLVGVLRAERSGPIEVRDEQISLRDDLLPDAGDAGVTSVIADLKVAVAETREDNAVLVLGHQPELSLIADQLLRRRRPWRPAPVPVDHAGIVCLASESSDFKDAWLVWAISYDDSEAAKEVREKVTRKMDVAKLLGSLLVVGLTVIFGVLFDQGARAGLGGRQWAVQVTGALLLLAAVLYLATMYHYDSLLMPERFWGEVPVKRRKHGRRSRWLVERPPSSAAFVLYQNMMRIWRNLFSLASLLMIGATGLLGYAALEVKPWILLVVGLPVAVLTVWWLLWSRPRLGSED